MIDPKPTPSASVLRYNRNDAHHCTVAVAVCMELVLAGVAFEHKTQHGSGFGAEILVTAEALPPYLFESLVNKIYDQLDEGADD